MKGARYKPVGWRGDSHRHYLAAKGISTKQTANKYFMVNKATKCPGCGGDPYVSEMNIRDPDGSEHKFTAEDIEYLDKKCPFDEPFHDHHDGCPSCTGASGKQLREALDAKYMEKEKLKGSWGHK